jgi:hypothetical protein
MQNDEFILKLTLIYLIRKSWMSSGYESPQGMTCIFFQIQALCETVIKFYTKDPH